ncbi:MAG: hypothetical protein HY328_04935 [Chloroflexi bacterium]|nr:hypothetical protein [Chloroflexota bacterium]
MELVAEQSAPAIQREPNALIKYLRHLPKTFRLQARSDSGAVLALDILEPETARRKANVWLLCNAGNLLGAKNSELVITDRVLWRFDVVLTSPGRGEIGIIGKLCLDAVTGEAVLTENLVAGYRENADKLSAR